MKLEVVTGTQVDPVTQGGRGEGSYPTETEGCGWYTSRPSGSVCVPREWTSRPHF